MALPYLPRHLLSNLVNPVYSVFCILYHEPLTCLMSPLVQVCLHRPTLKVGAEVVEFA